jgi:hypothetical protein
MPPPGAMPPAPMPPPMGGNGLGPGSPLQGMLSDLPTNLTPGWQAVDMAVRCLRTALRAEDMQKSERVVAVLQSQSNTLSKLLSAYTSGTASGNAEPSAGDTAEGSLSPNPDADSQPSASSSSDSGGDSGGGEAT